MPSRKEKLLLHQSQTYEDIANENYVGGTVVTRCSIQIQIAQEAFAQIVDPAMYYNWPILTPRPLYNFSLAKRVHLRHDVKLAQPTPTYLLARCPVQFLFVLAVYRAHIGKPILQRQS